MTGLPITQIFGVRRGEGNAPDDQSTPDRAGRVCVCPAYSVSLFVARSLDSLKYENCFVSIGGDRRSGVTGNSPRNSPRNSPHTSTYYDQLGLHPSASEREIRRAYRELSKRYHPDTTTLPITIATPKFQALNEAYATLSNYERRSFYDAKIRYSRVVVAQVPTNQSRRSGDGGLIQDDSPGFIDPIDRPLSSGELFALLLMGSTILGCLALAIAIAVLRGDPW